MEEADAAAVSRALSGDRDAFRVLVERHSRNVFRLAFRMTGNEQDAEDVVQVTFMRAWRSLASFGSQAGFGTWLHRIAANYSLDIIRQRKRRDGKREVSYPDGADILESIPGDAPGPERLAHSKRLRLAVRAAMEELTAQERTAFVLRHFEGLSIEEIGANLGTGTNATKHSIFRAVQKLRRALEPVAGVAR
ncbi:MAG TPA: sigma-70 family RNA polymerase sigma factor [Bryobacteraceae bacterium]|jgi:RNA polymerase sigma-70 factor (ECF subfamily)|nr:sigma-70 family RNA polymerase sigma factor [Bryobacteraceae bacterium]